MKRSPKHLFFSTILFAAMVATVVVGCGTTESTGSGKPTEKQVEKEKRGKK